ncbi:class I adenylate-forming enzyme family protein [Candidatus Solirubrobacter pratensis]|uniref:class I adenylate-forming enzyme family protein n=1 Tax=Candidatus Solirubrobacter pratensis TaxID=1298857 RepID=UPI0003FBB8F6|nr:AMP-binding protein [Candidatus Solirubrobacter pratensis]
MSDPYLARPWLDKAPGSGPAPPTIMDALAAEIEAGGERDLIRHGDGRISLRDADARADAVAAGLAARGIGQGDRVAIRLQNVPEFVYALLACWKLGAIAVMVSPMLRAGEIDFELEDSGAALLLAAEDLHVETVDAAALAREHAGERPAPARIAPEDVAVLTYTSGTTGPPKGAMNTHANLVHGARAYRDFAQLTPDDVIIGMAPLFHVTGLVAHVASALLVPMPLVLGGRFDAAATCALIERHRTTFTVAAITAFTAILNAPGEHDLSSMTKAYSGGAPVSVASAEAWERRSGSPLRVAYGLTETTSPAHLVPVGLRPPVDESSGALSIGIPVTATDVRIVDPQGESVAAGEPGEIAIRGPQVVPGYWERPDATGHAIPGGELRTGDVGLMDPEGWFYVIDRLKDQINASGFKVWPREVEDVLYRHPAVREVAVVGVPDEYRGETVKAFVSLKPGAEVAPDELIAYARERLASYKYPRLVELIDELPKTASGKILRRELRSRPDGP